MKWRQAAVSIFLCGTEKSRFQWRVIKNPSSGAVQDPESLQATFDRLMAIVDPERQHRAS